MPCIVDKIRYGGVAPGAVAVLDGDPGKGFAEPLCLVPIGPDDTALAGRIALAVNLLDAHDDLLDAVREVLRWSGQAADGFRSLRLTPKAGQALDRLDLLMRQVDGRPERRAT